MSDHKPFARLADTKHGQCLIMITQGQSQHTGEEGPTVVARIADVGDLEISMTLGPWTNDEEGADLAEKAFRELEFDVVADRLHRLAMELSEEVSGKTV